MGVNFSNCEVNISHGTFSQFRQKIEKFATQDELEIIKPFLEANSINGKLSPKECKQTEQTLRKVIRRACVLRNETVVLSPDFEVTIKEGRLINLDKTTLSFEEVEHLADLIESINDFETVFFRKVGEGICDGMRLSANKNKDFCFFG